MSDYSKQYYQQNKEKIAAKARERRIALGLTVRSSAPVNIKKVDAYKRLRVAVFYDGNYFNHCSNHYRLDSQYKSRISLEKLHEFVCTHIANEEGLMSAKVKVASGDFYIGRPKAATLGSNTIFGERCFEDSKMALRVNSHYSELFNNGEKGVDVELATDMVMKACKGEMDVAVLVAGDCDFVPALKKLTLLGIRTVVVSWDITHMLQGKQVQICASRHLTATADIHMNMSTLIVGKEEMVLDGVV